MKSISTENCSGTDFASEVQTKARNVINYVHTNMFTSLITNFTAHWFKNRSTQ